MKRDNNGQIWTDSQMNIVITLWNDRMIDKKKLGRQSRKD